MATYHDDGFYYAYQSALSTSEMETNARYIVNFFRGKGWTDNCIAGMLGNFQAESTINPARWENNTDYRAQGINNKGFGLAQWTPWRKYTQWCEDKGHTEWHMYTACHRIWTEFENVSELTANTDRYGGGQYYPNGSEGGNFGLTRSQFIKSTLSARELAVVFVRNYERPGSVLNGTEEQKQATFDKRGDNAERWWTFIQNNMEGGGTVTPPSDPAQPGTNYCNVASGEYVNIRAGAGTGYDVVGKLHRGDTVNVVSITDGWAKINSPVEGYVMASFLQPTHPDGGSTDPDPDNPDGPDYPYCPPECTTDFLRRYILFYKGRAHRVVR